MEGVYNPTSPWKNAEKPRFRSTEEGGRMLGKGCFSEAPLSKHGEDGKTAFYVSKFKKNRRALEME